MQFTIFAGSFLLFLIQPLLGKLILPAHGGTAGVWTVCLLFFQTLLVAGYAWAHVATPRRHIALLVVSLATLPLSLRMLDAGPTLSILATLALSAGLPYFTLAATSPLLQRWWTGDGEPYRLYALSNLGSLLALAAYPFVIEPWVSLTHQRQLWTAIYVLFAAACAATALRVQPPPAVAAPLSPGPTPWPWWLTLAACGSGLLAAITNQICQEIAPVPLLWILPLAVYLISFILTFDRPAFYRREFTGLLAGAAVVVACLVNVLGTRLPVAAQVLALLVALFLGLLVCHGELVRARPPAAALTRFYLAIAAGGALGGAFVALAAPALFTRYLEFPLLMAAMCMLGVAARWRDGSLTWTAATPVLARAHTGALAVGALTCMVLASPTPALDESRNFYGTLRVTASQDATGAYRQLAHGSTAHGLQYTDATLRRIPTAYYGVRSAPGLILDQIHAGRFGLIGLGAGTLARYGRAGDTYRFYEINPDVTRAARQWFTFLSDAQAQIEIVEGDARQRLAAEPPQQFRVLIVDAFSSDSIPVHLLTLEAGELYRRHLAPGGLLLLHISNRMLKLEPVVNAMADHLGFAARRLDSPGDKSRAGYDANWMILARDVSTLNALELPGAHTTTARPLAWTDDFASLWRVIDW